MRDIIGLTGNANAGKDTTADYIISLNNSFKKIAFADALKDMVIRYFGLTYEDVYTTEGKNRYNQFWNMTNREILQKVGTDAMRKGFCNQVWVKITENVLLKNPNQNFIISDIRFYNQAQMVKRNNGTVVRINRDFKIAENMHESEIPIKDDIIDYEIDNNSTFANLYKDIVLKLEKYIK